MNNEIVKVEAEVAPTVGVMVRPAKDTIYTDDFTVSVAICMFCGEADVKKSSMEVYARNLHLFFDWVQSTGRNVRKLTVADVKAWKEDLFATGKSSLTVASYLTALRKFYAWIKDSNIGEDITRGIKTPKRANVFQKQHLKREQATSLLQHFDPAVQEEQGKKSKEVCKATKRNFAIINLMLRTGLRTIEVVRADVGDLKYRDGKRVLWVHGKGHDTKDRYVMLTNKTFEPIKAYLEERGNVLMNEPLFCSESNRNSNKRLTTRTISWICKEGLRSKDVGLDGHEYTAHSLRHTAAVMVISFGGRIEDCQEMLRHSSPSTTQIYLNSIKEEQRLKRFAESRIDKAY